MIPLPSDVATPYDDIHDKVREYLVDIGEVGHDEQLKKLELKFEAEEPVRVVSYASVVVDAQEVPR